MRWFTFSALKRLALGAVILVVLLIVVWWIMIQMPLRSFRGPLPPLSRTESMLRDGLRRDVEKLARDIGERHMAKPNQLRAAVEYLEAALTNAGYAVARQTFQTAGEPCHNLEVELRGKQHPDEILVIGAHYDSAIGTPGANDNGSAVASLLALARAWAGRVPARSVRFVAFPNEEPPFFGTEQMGSHAYARRCRERNERVTAMLSLETMGYYSEAPGSQRYPFPVGLFYPSEGNFIAFVTKTGNAALVRRCVESFRRNAQFPSEGAALPAGLPGVCWSDHWAFWQAGYPAVMITDTAPFRYPFYHTLQDTPDKIDYERLARVVSGLDKVIQELAGQ